MPGGDNSAETQVISIFTTFCIYAIIFPSCLRGDTVNKKLQVFVSSTYTDLIEERQTAVEAILDAGHIPAGMELFKAGKSQMKTIKKWIDESDVYMLILGGRYGSIEEESGLSYTELEYTYALSKNMPVFAIVLDDSFLFTKAALQGKDAIFEKKNIKKYNKFKKFVKSKIVKEIDNIHKISSVIHANLYDILSDTDLNLSGWVRFDSVLGYHHSEIGELTKKFSYLQTELGSTNEKYNKMFNEYTELKNEHKNLQNSYNDLYDENQKLYTAFKKYKNQYENLISDTKEIIIILKILHSKEIILQNNFFTLKSNQKYTLENLFLVVYPLSEAHIQKIDLSTFNSNDKSTLINSFTIFYKHDLFESFYDFDNPFLFKILEKGHFIYDILMKR